ncbi:DUF1570 domain-containing protein [Paludisphaera borealis]|uniref:DUF1570 domain-containing protein n=1 Tax=Paludisphaera borealis TaxID=1387353 RepID=A0A1U7CPG0_9BACT|nr:DUF1570 domain-containing protein [Paludisphaera borealis]APW60799.1 hypothetical protein BSF38_02288 [Paludisphaera borealis]
MRRLDAMAGDLSRREWIRATALGVSGMLVGDAVLAAPQAVKKEDKPPIEIKDSDLAEVERKLEKAGITRVHRLDSAHYQAVGDAADVFMKSILGDCEQLAVAYLRHFKDRGFEIHAPERSLILLVFRDDRSFGKFFRMPSLPEAASKGIGAQMTGAYDRSTNLLNVFDWRNVPMAARSSHLNVQTVAHEGTHQLTFNTGLLNRSGDVPVSIIEGLGTYGEPRKVIGPSALGRINLRRLDDLAKLQRVTDWIPLHDLIVNDAIIREGLVVRVSLAYAQSWLLVHFLLNDAEFTPKFRDYLNAIRTRKTTAHRLDDAKQHLGDLAALDRALKAYSIRLLRSL